MAEASKTVEMAVPREKLLSVIEDYEKYPQFVEGVETVKVLSKEGGKARISYGISLIGKEITYVLDHVRDEDGIHWELVESNVLKSNSGGWSLKELDDDRTEVTYSLALEFKIYVPGLILNGLVKSSLPKMLESFEKRAKSL